MAKVLVCVAWPYANSPIHLGHVAGSLLPPDIFSRYRRLRGDEVLMVSGSDQHGTPITVRAEKENVTPLEVAERYHQMNKKAIEDLNIEFSLFTKTHTDNHLRVVSDVFLDLLEKDLLYEKATLQYFCPKCDKFLPDRYVEGICPACDNERARGDQCEQCGKAFEGGELREAKCVHCATAPELRETKHHFIRLSAFQDRLIDWVKDKRYWRPSVQLFTQNWLEAGLEDRPITRDMEWGVPVPLPGQEGKVIYVWFEAVIGYLSASIEWAQRSGDPDAWRSYWTDPEVKSYYFLGKDNIPFHTIIWPTILMGRGGLNLPYDVPANEFLTFKGDKVSKSRGTTIDIPSMLKKFEPDVIRYYVAANMPENKDADFSWEDFEAKINNELVATLGNYYHRVLSFTYKHFGEVPEFKGSPDELEEILGAIRDARRDVEEALDGCHFKRALKTIMDLAQFGNRHFDSVAPWALIKGDREKCGSALHLHLLLVKALAALSYPYMPGSSEKAWEFLGQEGTLQRSGWSAVDSEIAAHQKLNEPKPLFSKIEVEKDEGDPMYAGFETLNLKVGRILKARDHPNADSLLLLDVDIGKKIQVVAGLKAYYTKEEMEGKSVVVVSNLKPAKLRGEQSQGMLLAAEEGDIVKLVSPPSDSQPGDPVDSGLRQSDRVIEFKDFQKLILRVAEVSGDQLDVGRKVRAKAAGDLNAKKVIVYMPSEDAEEALVLSTDKGPVTADDALPGGATVR